MARSAERQLDLAFFYASDAGLGGAPDPERPTRLTELVEELEAAAAAGVAVRFLTDAGFVKTYPALLERLEASPDIEVRRYTMPVLDPDGHVIEQPGPGDPRPGAMHAKYVILDGSSVALGSANFDWRSLEHIHELGVLVHDDGTTQLVDAFQDVFDLDWHLAGGGSVEDAPRPRFGADQAPVLLEAPGPGWSGGYAGYWPDTWATPVFSPRGLLPDENLWDLPHLVAAIDGADECVRVELLTYKPTDRDGTWEALDGALRRAADRGVQVRLLVADWGKRASVLPGLVSLTLLPSAEVRFVTIPEDPGGHIPFARVIHGKYLVADDHTSWIGTANWSRDYFESGRNVGLLFEGHAPALGLIRIHDELWDSPYAYPVEPDVEYAVPDFGERD
jgi:phosphatidylserine/phosphatidylglycerophosphate/cardiolipin synthase-like enzyme